MKISQFPAGGQAQGTDLVPIVRAGQDFTVSAGTIGLLGSPLATTTPSDTAMGNGPPVLAGGQLGTISVPTTNAQPLVSYTKYSSANSAQYEGGAGWFSTYRESGTANSVGLTGYVKVDGGTADAVAIHGFAQAALGTTCHVFSGWFTSHDDNTVLQSQCFGVEIDLVLQVARPRVTATIGANAAVGLWINNQSDVIGPSLHATAAIGITGEIAANSSQWHTGIFFQQNSIVPGGANEAIQINGASIAGNRYSGLRLIGNFDVGIDLSGGIYTGTAAAILLPNLGAVVALDSVSGSYSIMYLNSGASNQLVLGQSVPGGIVLSTKTQCNGTVSIGGAAAANNVSLTTRTTSSLATSTQVCIYVNDTFSSSATASGNGLLIANASQAAAFTIGTYNGVALTDFSKGGASVVTNQVGLNVPDLTAGVNNYALYCQVAAGSNKWNLFATGTALNYMKGALLINTTTDNGVDLLQVVGSINATAVVKSSSNVAVPAAGATTCGILISATANLGYYFGSGAPTFSAAQGSVYSSTTGGVGARLYVNTNGGTTWAAATSP